jgi:type IV secretory pathway TrbD component
LKIAWYRAKIEDVKLRGAKLIRTLGLVVVMLGFVSSIWLMAAGLVVFLIGHFLEGVFYLC